MNFCISTTSYSVSLVDIKKISLHYNNIIEMVPLFMKQKQALVSPVLLLADATIHLTCVQSLSTAALCHTQSGIP